MRIDAKLLFEKGSIFSPKRSGTAQGGVRCLEQNKQFHIKWKGVIKGYEWFLTKGLKFSATALWWY